MSRFRVVTLLIICLAGSALMSFAQSQPVSHEEAIQRAWDRSVTKILEMARDFPEDMLDTSVGGGAQTFQQLVWHSIRSAQVTAYRAQGLSRDEWRGKLRALKQPEDKAGLVAALEKAYQESTEGLKANVPVSMASGIEHMAEQYGKLVAIYRASGMVPPRSRK